MPDGRVEGLFYGQFANEETWRKAMIEEAKR
jgi:hypothetical protein